VRNLINTVAAIVTIFLMFVVIFWVAGAVWIVGTWPFRALGFM
jgi:hypothetical protein